MKLKFDSTQPHQLAAVQSLVDLFDGQPLNPDGYTISIDTKDQQYHGGTIQEELGYGNQLLLSEEALWKNLHKIQESNELDVTPQEKLEEYGMNFSVEMETGTGKTYVYLRTIFELSQKYGFKKFIIVVPSVAIREGTLKNIEITKEHFKALYNNIEFESFVYDSKKPDRLRHFATSNQLQIMVINIDSFNKKDISVIHKESDKLSGHQPIEFVQATHPFVIIDEPQSVDNTPKAQDAIKTLNPLAIFRYSATHRNLYNLVYKLDPIKAYKYRLVKLVIVASARGDNGQNDAYIKLLEVDNKKGIKARILIHSKTKNGIKEDTIWVKQNDDLFIRSNEREAYRNGFEILEISAEPGNEYIEFTWGRLNLGQERGGIQEDLTEIQIHNTINKHLEKELQLKEKGIKVLSLFFIDRVVNYREYDSDGNPQKGKFAKIFEQHYEELIKLPKYNGLKGYPVEKIHDGYFSQDKKGILKDTTGSTQADDDTYAKIMRNKEQLLSLDEPLKFIFSHSALREGWDNPNVFQICTLNETRSVMKKRQEIGRGLRLPVNQEGERVFDENINKLTVVANESYDEFAAKLQTEYEEDCGVTFGKVPKIGFSKLTKIVDDQEIPLGQKNSEKIWTELVAKGFMDEKGKIQSSFNPKKPDFSLELSAEFQPLEAEIVTVLQSFQLERHIKKDEEPQKLQINKQVFLDPEFEELWDRIKHRTTYAVEYSTQELITNTVKAIKRMEHIESVKVSYREDLLNIENKG
ncbi:MAG: DEAD/DEAH box helicase family protein, partial [SAR324 cluster bacterium]|nr:DEAD/DEAH box helicase family protein [SAR324 cluster bacterium]